MPVLMYKHTSQSRLAPIVLSLSAQARAAAAWQCTTVNDTQWRARTVVSERTDSPSCSDCIAYFITESWLLICQ